MNKEEVKSTFKDVHSIYPYKISKELEAQIQNAPKDSSLRAQFLPSTQELDHDIQDVGLYDPIADTKHSQGNGIIHRYKNRVLFTPTTACPVNCRYCFRKNELAQNDEIFKANFDALLTYLDSHQEIEEVILTGGDPLSLHNKKLEEIFNALAGKIPYLRIHTRYLTTAPSRIDQELISLLKNYNDQFEQFSIAIHANHVDEFFSEAREKIKSLSLSGITLLSQSVLLKGVNDSVNDLVNLMKMFTKLKVRPYYLHHPDHVKGAMHFHLSLEEGRFIFGQLRDLLPGWAIPNYIIDNPSGSGKNYAYNPEKLESSGIILDRYNQEHPLLPN
jgi:lysine 2,3-aminomutase